jgi:hypothetical protein
VSSCTLQRCALLLRYRNIEAKQYRRRRIDRHRSGNFVEGNSVEQRFHIRKGIDGHADFAHFAQS